MAKPSSRFRPFTCTFMVFYFAQDECIKATFIKISYFMSGAISAPFLCCPPLPIVFKRSTASTKFEIQFLLVARHLFFRYSIFQLISFVRDVSLRNTRRRCFCGEKTTFNYIFPTLLNIHYASERRPRGVFSVRWSTEKNGIYF